MIKQTEWTTADGNRIELPFLNVVVSSDEHVISFSVPATTSRDEIEAKADSVMRDSFAAYHRA